MKRGNNFEAEVTGVQPAHSPLRLSNADGAAPRNPAEFKRAGCAFLIVVALSGCAGPSRKQYAVLLHECRESNREHLRLIHEYEKAVEECRGTHPEQAAGAAEMNLGGF